ncbi:MAG: hypothetical protein HRU44_03225 [Candidatus Thalassarchaeum sp.]|nr:hypothetical protein [Candidatus Thalassarchaeum sp.]
MTKLSDYCRQAIATKYLGPTDYRGARVVAVTEGGHRKIISWDHELNITNNHAVAASILFENMGWHKYADLVMGSTKDGYVFVQVPKVAS